MNISISEIHIENTPFNFSLRLKVKAIIACKYTICCGGITGIYIYLENLQVKAG